MPIEIKELHIKINVDEKQTTTIASSEMSKTASDELLKECVEQVMNIETRKNER
ncbi:MAG: hypothetical protein HRT69_03525 [Flavobacteriaceae bacterium]|nr:hypothetical protein [Flavobacteriaceae bacterium]